MEEVLDAPYEPFDPFADDPEGTYVVDEYLKSKGWEELFHVGDEDSPLHVESWRRSVGTGPDEYMVTVSDLLTAGPYLKVRSFADVMDLLARWAPAVQAASVVGLIDDISKGWLQDAGAVETIAAKAIYGAEVVSSKLRSEEAERRRLAAARLRERRLPNQGRG